MAVEKPVATRNEPYEVEVEAGKQHKWCSCGRSETQPWCDHAHKGTGLHSVKFTPEKTETVRLCGCLQTKTPPFCDDTHLSLK
jgi:CDGSH iron-sulfur domain-containing protein 3